MEDDQPLFWMGSSKEDVSAFPDDVKLVMGFALRLAQQGHKHSQAKHMTGLGSGVLEIVEDDGDAYRCVYLVRLEGAVYGLHAFQKKSTKGVKTSARDIATIKRRIKLAEKHHEQLRRMETGDGQSRRKGK